MATELVAIEDGQKSAQGSVSLRVAEKYVEAFSQLAKESNTVVIPAQLGDLGGMIEAAMGIYGVMSYSVEQRTHEIGIRTALGATRRDTLILVLFQALRITVAGLAVGVAAAFGLTRLLNAQLFGVKPSDPLTFTSAPLILLLVALAAACIPALRASRVDPVVALRHE